MDTRRKFATTEPSLRRLAIGSVLVAIGCAVLLLATSPGLPMAWDEGNAIGRAEGIGRWAQRWVFCGQGAGRPGPLSQQAIAEHWRYTTQLEGHPPFYGVVIAVGRRLSAGWLGPLESARFGPMLLFGLAAGAMFYRMGRDYSPAAAFGAVGALLLLPRMFAHAHFASFDGPLTSCWVLAWAAFASARTGWRGAIVWGVVLGMTFSAKATGWLALLPFLAWAALYRDRAALRALAVGVPVAGATFFLLNPPLWHHPLEGTATFFQLNFNRAAQPGINISTWFLGRMYNLDYPLPWYNTLFWTGITVPLGTLLLLGVGLVAVFRRWPPEKAGTLLVANWLVLLVIRGLPIAPPHDGVRLFLPSFAFLAALAGVGCDRVLAAAAGWRGGSAKARRVAAAGVLLVYAGTASSLFWYRPQWLSYYNLLIGGLPGATAAGMEPTYYWDALDRATLDWLARHTAPGEKVHFAASSPENLALMRRWGTLRCEYRPGSPGLYRWYVVQHRPSGWQPEDRWLIEHGRPAYRKTIRRAGWGPWRLDVPLVEVYSYDQHLAARRATAR